MIQTPAGSSETEIASTLRPGNFLLLLSQHVRHLSILQYVLDLMTSRLWVAGR